MTRTVAAVLIFIASGTVVWDADERNLWPTVTVAAASVVAYLILSGRKS